MNDVMVIEPRRFEDDRGWFMETFKQCRSRQRFEQDSLSYSKRNVLRGLHMQLPHAQGKLVYCVTGRVRDVAVDLREGSPTYGQHVVHEISAEDGRQIYIPEGFAHGFVVLSEDALFAYKSTVPYDPDGQVSIRWDDPDLGIDWGVTDPILSEKDADAPLLRDASRDLRT